MFTRFWPVVLCLLALSGACSRSNSPTTPAPAPSPDVTSVQGTWTGDLTLQGQPVRMRWVLSQNGTAVEGPVLITTPAGIVLLNGRLNGTVSGTSLAYTIAVSGGGVPGQPSCAGEFRGSASVAPGAAATLSGGYALASSNCPAPVPDGAFVLTRS